MEKKKTISKPRKKLPPIIIRRGEKKRRLKKEAKLSQPSSGEKRRGLLHRSYGEKECVEKAHSERTEKEKDHHLTPLQEESRGKRKKGGPEGKKKLRRGGEEGGGA